MKRILPLIFSLMGCAMTQPEPEPEPEPKAFVSVAENARAGGMRISRIDGEPVADDNGFSLDPGTHTLSVACQLDNGIRTNFDFEVDLMTDHSYCFFSRDEGKACTIVYTQISWQGGGAVTCR